jgi:hypothetical protein
MGKTTDAEDRKFAHCLFYSERKVSLVHQRVMKFMVMERNFKILGYYLNGREVWDQCCARNRVDFTRVYGSFCSLSYFSDIVFC